MAQLALNKFQTETFVVTNAEQTVYTAPTGYTAIVLYAHITNITSSSTTVSLYHNRSGTQTELIVGATVPGNDAYIPLDGKLVLETSDTLSIIAGANNTLKFILSILETAN
tara:strand:+ start:47 stop:379 length:333 start_codon:yes stop_codon:yes gene_type:complete